ncbi:MAG TPA: DUF5671 domain-containing protein [Gemmatimonadaceae bacterium]|nr:DUF5671 domain-containing protein [Gemmatimonadaceae bacterium]
MSESLLQFVKESLARGLTRDQIQNALLSAGWPADQVKRALGSYAPVEFPVPVPRPPVSAAGRERSMYLLLLVTLAVSSFNLGSLLFELINRAFPDPAAVTRPFTLEAIRWSIASLVVTFPIFLYVVLLVDRQVQADPLKRASRHRRNVTYVALVLTAAILIGVFITLVYNLLGGDLTARFMLKSLTVAGISGSIFVFGLRDLRRSEAQPET